MHNNGNMIFFHGEMCPQTGHRFSRRSAGPTFTVQAMSCRDQRYWTEVKNISQPLDVLRYCGRKINTSGIRRCSRALRVNMKPTSEKVLPPRASRCDCPSCSSRGRALSTQYSTIAPLRACRSGHAAREDVNDSLFGKCRAGQLHHGDDGLLFLSIFLQLGRESLQKCGTRSKSFQVQV